MDGPLLALCNLMSLLGSFNGGASWLSAPRPLSPLAQQGAPWSPQWGGCLRVGGGCSDQDRPEAMLSFGAFNRHEMPWGVAATLMVQSQPLNLVPSRCPFGYLGLFTPEWCGLQRGAFTAKVGSYLGTARSTFDFVQTVKLSWNQPFIAPFHFRCRLLNLSSLGFGLNFRFKFQRKSFNLSFDYGLRPFAYPWHTKIDSTPDRPEASSPFNALYFGFENSAAQDEFSDLITMTRMLLETGASNLYMEASSADGFKDEITQLKAELASLASKKASFLNRLRWVEGGLNSGWQAFEALSKDVEELKQGPQRRYG